MKKLTKKQTHAAVFAPLAFTVGDSTYTVNPDEMVELEKQPIIGKMVAAIDSEKSLNRNYSAITTLLKGLDTDAKRVAVVWYDRAMLVNGLDPQTLIERFKGWKKRNYLDDLIDLLPEDKTLGFKFNKDDETVLNWDAAVGTPRGAQHSDPVDDDDIETADGDESETAEEDTQPTLDTLTLDPAALGLFLERNYRRNRELIQYMVERNIGKLTVAQAKKLKFACVSDG